MTATVHEQPKSHQIRIENEGKEKYAFTRCMYIKVAGFGLFFLFPVNLAMSPVKAPRPDDGELASCRAASFSASYIFTTESMIQEVGNVVILIYHNLDNPHVHTHTHTNVCACIAYNCLLYSVHSWFGRAFVKNLSAFLSSVHNRRTAEETL